MKNISLEDLEDLKAMSLDEFVNIGLLQEVNRKFFHPMGLALSVNVDKKSGKVLGFYNIWDVRNDPEGMCFDETVIVNNVARAKAAIVEEMFNAKKEYREKNLGYHIQPLISVGKPKV